MSKSIIYTLFIVFIFNTKIIAQVSINTTETAPDASAMLDVSSVDKGLLIPRMTTVQRNLISNPADGLMVYDKTTNSFWFYNGTIWDELVDTENTAANTLKDDDGNTKIQVEESANEDKIRFDIAGNEAFVLRTNANGNAIFEFQNTNTFIGKNAGLATNTGFNNTFFGALAGTANTTGTNNLFLGQNAGAGNLTGNLNVFIGQNAGQNQATGDRNVYIGNSAGAARTGGSQNVIIGRNSGNAAYNGSRNVFIGGGDAGNTITGSDKLEINVGIINVMSGDFSTNELSLSKDLTITGIISMNGNWISSDGDNEGIFIDNNGRVGFNTNTPTVDLDVTGNFKQDLSTSTFNFSSLNLEPVMLTNPTKVISLKVSSNGTKTTSYTTSNWASTTKNSTGTYTISFTSGTFTKVPILTGITASTDKLVIQSISASSAVIEIRDMSGNLTDSEFMLNIIGE